MRGKLARSLRWENFVPTVRMRGVSTRREVSHLAWSWARNSDWMDATVMGTVTWVAVVNISSAFLAASSAASLRVTPQWLHTN